MQNIIAVFEFGSLCFCTVCILDSTLNDMCFFSTGSPGIYFFSLDSAVSIQLCLAFCYSQLAECDFCAFKFLAAHVGLGNLDFCNFLCFCITYSNFIIFCIHCIEAVLFIIFSSFILNYLGDDTVFNCEFQSRINYFVSFAIRFKFAAGFRQSVCAVRQTFNCCRSCSGSPYNCSICALLRFGNAGYLDSITECDSITICVLACQSQFCAGEFILTTSNTLLADGNCFFFHLRIIDCNLVSLFIYCVESVFICFRSFVCNLCDYAIFNGEFQSRINYFISFAIRFKFAASFCQSVYTIGQTFNCCRGVSGNPHNFTACALVRFGDTSYLDIIKCNLFVVSINAGQGQLCAGEFVFTADSFLADNDRLCDFCSEFAVNEMPFTGWIGEITSSMHPACGCSAHGNFGIFIRIQENTCCIAKHSIFYRIEIPYQLSAKYIQKRITVRIFQYISIIGRAGIFIDNCSVRIMERYIILSDCDFFCINKIDNQGLSFFDVKIQIFIDCIPHQADKIITINVNCGIIGISSSINIIL